MNVKYDERVWAYWPHNCERHFKRLTVVVLQLHLSDITSRFKLIALAFYSGEVSDVP